MKFVKRSRELVSKKTIVPKNLLLLATIKMPRVNVLVLRFLHAHSKKIILEDLSQARELNQMVLYRSIHHAHGAKNQVRVGFAPIAINQVQAEREKNSAMMKLVIP